MSQLPPCLLNEAARADEPRGRRRTGVELQGERTGLLFTPIGHTASGELVVAVEAGTEVDDEARLRVRFGLTTRECEVLVWVARGKSNRDVGQILALSPRTVNKHLERVFVKLGVENRAAAAAVAIGVLSERA
jgi:DNA-binding CsgD family transcriptional regulator